jgi:hypothetical protein
MSWHKLLAVARLSGFAAAGALTAFCQVQVTVQPEKPRYLVGEPVFVVALVKNVGTEPVGHSYCDGRVDVTVEGVQKRRAPNLGGCFSGGAGGGGCGIDHPPLMKPGQTVSFRYLLKDYRLSAGNYVLHVSGKAGVRWKYYHYNLRPGDPPPPPPQHREVDPVEGATFTASLPITVEDGTDEELRARYAPYVADVSGYDPERRILARQAVSEMAPPFLEKIILRIAGDQQYDSKLGVKGLGRIGTPESRADLIGLFDRTTDLSFRRDIVQALAESGTTTEIAFFASLLPGRSNELDDRVRVYAAWGLGRVGGDQAVQALIGAPKSPNQEVRFAVVVALGNTRSRSAVPALIRMYEDPEARGAVCGALLTITHYRWCDGAGEVDSTVKHWQRWWTDHGAGLPLYGPDECPPFRAVLPSVGGPPVVPVPK